MYKIFLQIQPNGDVINWGRNVTVNGERGSGGAYYFAGEDAKILRLILKYSGKNNA